MRVLECSFSVIIQIFLSIIGIPLLLLMIGIYRWLFTREDVTGLVSALFSEDYRLWWVYGAILATIAAYIGYKSGNRYLGVFFTMWPISLMLSFFMGLCLMLLSLIVALLLAVLTFIVMWFLNSPYPDIQPMIGLVMIGMTYIGLSYPIAEFILDPDAGINLRLLTKI